MVDEPTEVTLQDVLDFHVGLLDEAAESFPGDMPEESISTIVRYAAGFETIMGRLAVRDAHEDAPDLDEGELETALEQQAVDMLAALSALQREFDLDIVGEFRGRRAQVQAIRSAQSMEELVEAMDQTDMDIAGLSALGPGDNVDNEDYDPDRRDREVY